MEWHTKIKLNTEDYINCVYSLLSTQLNDTIAELYWIPNPSNPNEIMEGYIGVTKRGHLNRFNEHLSFPNKNIKEFLHLNNKNELKVVHLSTGSYMDALKCENYFRPKWNIGWNIAIGGQGGGPDPIKVKETKSLENNRRKSEGIPTYQEELMEKRILHDIEAKSNGTLTASQKSWKTYWEEVRPRMVIKGELTGEDKRSISHKNLHRKLISENKTTVQGRGWETYKANKKEGDIDRSVKVAESLGKRTKSKKPHLFMLADLVGPTGKVECRDTVYSLGKLFANTGSTVRQADRLFNLIKTGLPIKKGEYKNCTIKIHEERSETIL